MTMSSNRTIPNSSSVKFTFRNSEHINDAESDLGDLTVIAESSIPTGKTYLVYTLYGFLKMYKHTTGLPFEWVPDSPDLSSIGDQILRSLITSGQATHPVDVDAFNHTRQLMLKSVDLIPSRKKGCLAYSATARRP